MKISALNMSFSALAIGLLVMAHSSPEAFGREPGTNGKKHEPGREVIERLGPHDNPVEGQFARLEKRVEQKESLTIDEYLEIQGALDELLEQANENWKSGRTAEPERFEELLELQEALVGIDVH